MVNLEQIKLGVISFIDKELGEKSTGGKKFLIYFISPIMIESWVNKYSAKLKSFTPELFDENNNVDLDRLYNMAKNAIRRSGQFEFMGIIFNETDLDKLFAHIKSIGNN